MAQDYTQLDLIVADSPGASIDKEFFDELKLNLQDAAASGSNIQTGIDSFNGLSGTAVTITEMDDTDYMVVITPTESPGGNLGEVWVVNDSTTQFTVYCSGSATTNFRWGVIA